MTFCIVTSAVFHEWHVTRDLACPPETPWTDQPGGRLSVALVRVRVAGSVTRMHTQGCGPPPQVTPWEDFMALADSHSRIAVHTTGYRGLEDIKECVQQAWFQVKSRLTCLANLPHLFQLRVAPGDLPVAILLKRRFLSRFVRS